MNCASVQPQLSAWLDQELSDEARRKVDEHLAGCAACRAVVDDLQRLHQQCNAELKVSQEEVNRLVESALAHYQPATLVYRPRPWRAVTLAIMSAAAGFLLALAVLPEWWKKTQVANVQPTNREQSGELPVQLALAIGTVEVEDNGAWKPLATGTKLHAGQRLRTPGKSRCELRCSDGSEVRLNSNCELIVHTPRLYQLKQGQVWSTVAPDRVPFQIKTDQSTVTALGTQFDLNYQEKLTTLTVLEGKTRLEQTGGKITEVNAGQQLEVDSQRGSFDLRQPDYQLYQATNWVNEILVLKGRDNPELIRRINDVMASIGETKMIFMAEEEMRTLGDHCVVPLCRYLQSERSKKQEERRQLAARIIADLAQPRSIGDLIDLLGDSDPQVRASLAKALLRLTRQDMGMTIQQWQSSDELNRAKALERWKSWWKRNQERYPESGKVA